MSPARLALALVALTSPAHGRDLKSCENPSGTVKLFCFTDEEQYQTLRERLTAEACRQGWSKCPLQPAAYSDGVSGGSQNTSGGFSNGSGGVNINSKGKYATAAESDAANERAARDAARSQSGAVGGTGGGIGICGCH